MTLRKAFALLFIAFLFAQCQKDLSNIGNPDPIPVLPEPIATRLQGTVLDENGIPMDGVLVKAGSQTAITDSRGYFRFQNANLDKKSSVVTAEKSGYFKGYRTFAATSGTNQVIIKLIPKILIGTINSSTGGNVTLSNGGSIALPVNAVVKKSDNSSYTGTVNIFAAYIDPTAADIDQTVPGSFMANNKNGNRVILESYGMMAVLLESLNAEPLQIKAGSLATLTTPIPATLISSAPSTIAMWSVNETTGIWSEEGTATRQANVYVGEVSHFSFWNCDVGLNSILLSLTLNSSNGEPLVHARIRLSRQTGPWAQSNGWTDSLGQVSGFVPSNETLLLEVIDPCGTAFYSQSIGPFTQHTNLPAITISATSSHIFTVTGQLLDCSNNPVTNGFARVFYGYYTKYAATDSNGNFSMNFITCNSASSTIDITGVDNTSMQQTELSNVNVVTPITNVGAINVCGIAATEFLTYTLRERGTVVGTFTYMTPSDSLVGHTDQGILSDTTFMAGSDSTEISVLVFTHPAQVQVPGSYNILTMMIPSLQSITIVPDAGSTVTLTSFPATPGMFYEGAISAAFLSGVYTVTGNFKVRRRP